jgi:HD-GYP domain-containing protein (c-di-GMP phosphodiesterase class II)
VLDAQRVNEAVRGLTESMLRNPDAMQLFTQLQKKDDYTLSHALDVSVYMTAFGRFLEMPREDVALLGHIGLLQDIGKVRLPDELLAKRERLTPEELELAKRHVEFSVEILRAARGLPQELPALAGLHHERHDGSGYPKGLRGGEIGLFGGIAGLVDCFDALIHPRPYGEALAPSNALNTLYGWRNTQFDGPLVEQFIHCVGIFPVGAFVELDSGEVGIVIAQNPVMRLIPRVMVVQDRRGGLVKPPRIVNRAGIKRTLEKSSVAIDPSEYFV